MNKILLIIIVSLGTVVFLTGCNEKNTNLAVSNNKSNISNTNNKMYREIKNNKLKWNKRVKDVSNVQDIKSDTSYAMIPSDLTELKNNSESLIRGTVTNLESTEGAKNTAITKVSIYVDEVLHGNDDLKGRIIKIPMEGGFVRAKDLYYQMNDKISKANSSIDANSNEQIYLKDFNKPLPKIGYGLITGIDKMTLSGVDPEIDAFFVKNGLDGDDSYSVPIPDYNLWIKDEKSSTYSINNTEVNQHIKKFKTGELNMLAKKNFDAKIGLLTNEVNKLIQE